MADDGDAFSMRAAWCESSEDVEWEPPFHGLIVTLLDYAVHTAPANKTYLSYMFKL